MGAPSPSDLKLFFPDFAAIVPIVSNGNTCWKVSILNWSKDGGKAFPCSSIK